MKGEGLDDKFIDALVQQSIDPHMLHAMSTCKWDKAMKVLTTPEYEEKAKEQEIESAAWYKDEWGLHMADKGRQGKKTHAAPEQLYDLDGGHSVNTIFGKNDKNDKEGKGYAGTPGAASINLGKAKTAEVINVDHDSNEMSVLSTMTKEDLIALLRKTTILSSKKKGSAPTSDGSQSHASNSKSSYSNNSSSTDSSSSSSGEESEAGIGTGSG